MPAELALMPFKPVKMKVLQCSFLSGIQYVYFYFPLLSFFSEEKIFIYNRFIVFVEAAAMFNMDLVSVRVSLICFICYAMCEC